MAFSLWIECIWIFTTLQDKIRPLWRTYTRNTDAIIFVLDSADYRSFDQARAGAGLDNNTIVRETSGILHQPASSE